jgi:hypothetical protein
MGETFYEGCQGPSNFYLCCLAQFLSCDVGQVNVFVVGFMVSPHHKDNLKPLGAQGSQRAGVAMPFSPLLSIVMIGPFTLIKRGKSQPVSTVTHDLVTRETKLHQATFAAGLSDRHRSSLGLKVTKRFPAIGGIAQFSPQGGYDRAGFGPRQALNQGRCRHRDEKTSDPVAVTIHRVAQGSELEQKDFKQLRLSSNHMIRHRKLGWLKLLPQFLAARLAEMVLAPGKSIPLPRSKLGKSLGRGIGLEKIQRNVGFQVLKHLQHPGIVFLERHSDLIEHACFVARQTVKVSAEQFKLLGLCGVGLKRSQMDVIGAQKFCHT